MIKDIYTAMQQCNIPCSNHESDLYVPVNEITTKIVGCYEFKKSVKTFVSSIEKTLFYDIPFAFNPFWEKRIK